MRITDVIFVQDGEELPPAQPLRLLSNSSDEEVDPNSTMWDTQCNWRLAQELPRDLLDTCRVVLRNYDSCSIATIEERGWAEARVRPAPALEDEDDGGDENFSDIVAYCQCARCGLKCQGMIHLNS